MSSSSWGCELKCNAISFLTDSLIVILFVRMWVEMLSSMIASIKSESSSSWGCELKYKSAWRSHAKNSHPLREDVSWNVEWGTTKQPPQGHPLREDVSWNDDTEEEREENVGSSSSWGCELKCTAIKASIFENRHPLREDVSWNNPKYGIFSIAFVILFVRMWVEICLKILLQFIKVMSSSSWGCELKWLV